jgi:hypothetical protein
MTDLMTIWELIKVAFIMGATFTLVAGSVFIGSIICAIPFFAAYEWLKKGEPEKEEPKP